MNDVAAARFSAAAHALVNQVSHWTPARWTSPAKSAPTMARAQVMFALVQSLADLVARSEDRAPQPVPRLDNDLSLADQFRVMVADLVLADATPATLETAAELIESIRL